MYLSDRIIMFLQYPAGCFECCLQNYYKISQLKSDMTPLQMWQRFHRQELKNVHHTVLKNAQWARIPKNLAKNRFYEIKQLRRNLFPFVLTSSSVTSAQLDKLCSPFVSSLPALEHWLCEHSKDGYTKN